MAKQPRFRPINQLEQAMNDFAQKRLTADPDLRAPDGSEVRVLLSLSDGSMAHFQLQPNQTTRAVVHRTVEEIWYVLSGKGEMWRALREHEEIIELTPGLCLTIPVGTQFQFRNTGSHPFAAVAITMPPWPADGEAVFVDGPWLPSVDDSKNAQ
jgi:mannose-6-phosphate isomerase-like protein (cupin superfamily)